MTDRTLQDELDTFKKNVSIYVARKDPSGNPVKMGIAFYYLDKNGKKCRKVLIGDPGNDMMKKREAFLTELFNEKSTVCKRASSASPSAMIPPLYHPALVPAQAPFADILVRDAVDRQLREYRPTVTDKTYNGTVSQANHVKRILGDKRVSEIGNSDFQYLVNTLSVRTDGSPAAPKSVDNIKIYFKRLIRFCWCQKWISADDRDRILADVRTPTFVTCSDHEKEVKESKYRTYAELGNILHVLSGNRRYYYVARVLLLTGLRPQELFALRFCDLVREEGYIYIRQAQIDRNRAAATDRTVGIGPTKNKQSRRKVPAVPVVFEYLDELDKIQVADGSRQKAADKGCGDLVIVDREGRMAALRYFGRNMKGYQLRHGIERPFLLDMGRHCYQDDLDGLGAKDADVERAVGHTLPNVANKNYKTYEHYLERLPTYIEKMNSLIEAEFQKAGGSIWESQQHGERS